MRGKPLTTTLKPEDHAYIEGLAKALNQSVSSVLAEIVHNHIVLAEIVHNHIVAEERRWTSTPAVPRKRK